MDALGIMPLDAVRDVFGVENLIDGAVQTDDVVVARILPAAAAHADGVAVHGADIVA